MWVWTPARSVQVLEKGEEYPSPRQTGMVPASTPSRKGRHMTKTKKKQHLLVSIRGAKEALAAAKGGAHIADVEYPASALGTPYPLNIHAVRGRLNKAGYKKVAVSTNIGEVKSVRASSCQAALGVATAGADLMKFGLAEQSPEAACYLAESIVRTVRKFHRGKKLFSRRFSWTTT